MTPSTFQAAHRYAAALFEIARLVHKDQVIEEELEAFSKALKKEPDTEKFLLDPRLSVQQKRVMLLKIYQERNHEIYEQLLDFFTLLFEKDRFALIHNIAVEFKRISDEAQGRGTAEIVSAAPLKPEKEAVIVAGLEKLAGYKIELSKKLDPALVGGVVVRYKNKIIDGSVHHKIQMMKQELTRSGTI